MIPVLVALLLRAQDGGLSLDALADRLRSDDIEVRDSAAQEILSRWTEWREEDLQALDERRAQDPETSLRLKDIVGRIHVRRAAGVRLLNAMPDLEDQLLPRTGAGTAALVRTLGDRFRQGSLPSADVLGLLNWVRLERAGPEVEEAFAELEKAGIRFDPSLLLPELRSRAANDRRRAALTLARLQAVDLAEHLLPLLRDSDVDVRIAARQALVRMQARGVASRIEPLLASPSHTQRYEAVALLERIGARGSAKAVQALLKDPSPFVRLKAASAVRTLGAQEAALSLVELLKDPDALVRMEAARALAELHSDESKAPVAALLKAEDPGVRAAALQAAAGLRLPLDGALLDDPDPEVRWTAVRALAARGERAHAAKAADLLGDPSEWVRLNAVRALADLRETGRRDDILRILKDPSERVRAAALESLGTLGSSEDREILIPALKDPSWRIRLSATRGMSRLGRLPPESLRALLADAHPAVREAALQSCDDPVAAAGALTDPHPMVRRRAAMLLAPKGRLEDLRALLELLEDPYSRVRSATAFALASRVSREPEWVLRPALIGHLHRLEWSSEPEVSLAAGIGLLRLGRKDPAAQRRLLTLGLGAESDVAEAVLPPLFDALLQTRAPDVHSALHASSPDNLAALKASGWALSGETDPLLGAILLRDRPATIADLLARPGHGLGIFADGKTVEILPARTAAARWLSRLAGK